MAGQRENPRLIGRETEEAYVKRLMAEGTLVPPENAVGVENALNDKKLPSFLTNLFNNEDKQPKAPKKKKTGPSFLSQLIEFLKPNDLGDRINETKGKL